MNFNIYVNKAVGEKLTHMAEVLHRSRNSIISEAIEEWLQRHNNRKWPKNFFDFDAVDDVPDFKELRKELKNEKYEEDPFA